MHGSLPFAILIDPGSILRELARSGSPLAAPVRAWLPALLLLPPVCAMVGGIIFGWRLGTAEPLYLDFTQGVTISFFYLLTLDFGFFTTVLLARWMAQTYGADASFENCAALFTVVCAPLSVASIAHLYPHVFFNVLVLIPAVIWSMTLLYRGVPVVLGIPAERGMLMSSALVGWLLVAAVSLLGISTMLWTAGLGPAIRI